MRVVTSTGWMRGLALGWKRRGIRVGLVPTMGCLHDGHLSLVRRARGLVGPKGQVVVSIYVNPTQFGPKEDWSRYPRDLPRDQRLCREAGVDVVFAPTDEGMYANAAGCRHSTYVVEETLSTGMEGGERPGHFRGVTTVVAKLFNLVLPDVAVFGAKDYQQAMVIRRMARDLNYGVRVVVAPTRRERDGLAMSSRNGYLNVNEREQAKVLWQAIEKARRAVRSSDGGLSAARLTRELTQFIQKRPAARVGYVAFFDPETLEPVKEVRAGVQMALAVRVGKTRLIDNGRI
jgi:pantoate--beta-alanine ligase